MPSIKCNAMEIYACLMCYEIRLIDLWFVGYTGKVSRRPLLPVVFIGH